MPAPKIPPLQADLALLVAPFQAQAIELVARCDKRGLPLVTYETLRAIARQNWLADKGYSRARGLAGPHCWALAIDRILDTKHPYWRLHGEWPQKVDGGGAAWDTGYEIRRGAWPNAGPGANGDRLVLVRPSVAAVWRAYGEEAMAMGLTWGGNQASKDWASGTPGAEFGWDPCHVQRSDWRILSKGMVTPVA